MKSTLRRYTVKKNKVEHDVLVTSHRRYWRQKWGGTCVRYELFVIVVVEVLPHSQP